MYRIKYSSITPQSNYYFLFLIDETDDDSYEDYDSDEALDNVPSLDGDRFSNFSEEETKSKFTSYSMSSSVIRRNEQLTQLDDQFEKFMDQYDEDEVGALEMDDDIGKKINMP